MGSAVGNLDQSKYVQNDEKYDAVCLKCRDIRRGSISNGADTIQGVKQGRTCFKFIASNQQHDEQGQPPCVPIDIQEIRCLR